MQDNQVRIPIPQSPSRVIALQPSRSKSCLVITIIFLGAIGCLAACGVVTFLWYYGDSILANFF